MSKKREHVINRPDGFRTSWRFGPRSSGEVHVDVFKDGELVLEWSFPRISGEGLIGNSTVFNEQVLLYAEDELAKRHAAKADAARKGAPV